MWERLPLGGKSRYKKYILSFASISGLQAQKADEDDSIAPVISSKFHEKTFCHVFGATQEDQANTSFDASLRLLDGDGEHRYIIGLKTFGISSGFQKIAQFKSSLKELDGLFADIVKLSKGKDAATINSVNHDRYMEIALFISEIRNSRIRSSIENLRGFRICPGKDDVESVYHVLMPSGRKESRAFIAVGETDYVPIDTDNITIIGCTGESNPQNFDFTDGRHRYRFTKADSQLLMDFRNREIVRETWDAVFIADPYAILDEIAIQIGIDDYRAEEEETSVSPTITESHSWMIATKDGDVERYSGFNNFYGVSTKQGLDQRRMTIARLMTEWRGRIPTERFNAVMDEFTPYFLSTASDAKERLEREKKRERIVCLLSGLNPLFRTAVMKCLYRPVNEIYIPIRNAASFHKAHPDFFAKGAAMFKADGKKLALPPEQRSFTLMFEPSGDTIEAFITQDFGKGIESCEKQSYLGEWILRKVFQLKEREPLTARRLEELEINAFRLYRTNADDFVHMEFIYIDRNNPPSDFVV